MWHEARWKAAFAIIIGSGSIDASLRRLRNCQCRDRCRFARLERVASEDRDSLCQQLTEAGKGDRDVTVALPIPALAGYFWSA
jgi:hypothetical protein